VNWRVHRFSILASTNDLALTWMRSGRATAGDVIVAGEQTAGRGRPGRAWHSAKGSLLMTAVLPFPAERAGWVALAAGVAVARAARSLGVEAGVKWPNDVVLNGRKLAGVLAEVGGSGPVAVGVGLNVCNPLPEDPELALRIARLADVAPGVTVEAALDAVLEQLALAWTALQQPDLTPLRHAWQEMDATVGREVLWSHGPLHGIAEGFDEAGALLIRGRDGRIVRATIGEVTFL
jgi:BirA family biotin operon repressor/biotin-[acetyl-CoA-carboxylase] ligase